MAALGVIFDMDGVLVDSGEPHRESWQLLGVERGRPITDEEFSSTFGRTSREIIGILFGDRLPADEVRALDARKEALYRDLVRGRVPIMPGARELLRALHGAGLRLAVGSSGPPENLVLVIEALGVGELFSGVVSGADVSRGKPDPEVFLLAADRIGVWPSRAVVVEDAPAGLEAARRAGMKAIGLTSSHPRASLAAADRIVDRLEAIDADLVRALVST